VAGRLAVGTGATASTYLLPPLLRRLHARHPDLELTVVTGNSADMVAAVAATQLDVAVVTLPVAEPALTVTPLMPDALVAIAPAAREWRRRRALTAAELARHPLILYERGGTVRRVIEDWFRRGGATPRVAMELGNAEAIKKMVEAGLGLAVTSAISVTAEVRARTLVALPLTPPLGRRLAIVRRRDRAPSRRSPSSWPASPSSPRARRSRRVILLRSPVQPAPDLLGRDRQRAHGHAVRGQRVLHRVGHGRGPGMAPPSPTPLAPSGVNGEGCSSRPTSMSGMSSAVGLR
jgi:hypothetical protein